MKNKDDLKNDDSRSWSSIYVVCTCSCLLGSPKNELVLSLYSLNSKTSRYAHFGRNRITGYGHPEFRLMLPLQPQIWISEHPDFRLRSVAYCSTTGFPFVRIRLAAFNSDKLCLKFGLPFVRIRIAACYSDCYSELFSKIIVLLKNFI